MRVYRYYIIVVIKIVEVIIKAKIIKRIRVLATQLIET